MVFITNSNLPSAEVRGNQVAEHLGERVFDELSGSSDGFSVKVDETVIFVKCVPDNLAVLNDMSNVYFDIVDSDVPLQYIQQFPHVKVIVMSSMGKRYVNARVENPVTVIPQHHCNFENTVRCREDVSVVGYVGSKLCLDLNVEYLRDRLAAINMEFKTLFVEDKSTTREDVCEFYKNIDIQLVFRRPRCLNGMPPELKDTLKIANAGSFKIPTVGYPELTYAENAGGLFLAVTDVKSIPAVCETLKSNRDMYNLYATKVHQWSQQFDISYVGLLYKRLLI